MSTTIDQTTAHAQKRKILLVTLYGTSNYGNSLQRYALSRVLEGYGFEVTHLCDVPSALRKVKAKLKLIAKHILALLGFKKFRAKILEPERNKRFREFQGKFAVRQIFMQYSGINSTDKSEWDKYDYAVTGSDQVWKIWSHTHSQAEYFISVLSAERRESVTRRASVSHISRNRT